MLSNARFYYRTTRKAVIAFGSLFTNLYLQRTDDTGNIQQSIQVPLTYCNKSKWLASIMYKQDSEDRQFQTSLPRMAFEITNYDYAPQRKIQTNLTPNKYIVQPVSNITDATVGLPKPTSNQLTSAYPPTPYTLTFKLYIIAKHHDDMLQMVEQILPFFNPTHSVSVKWIPELNVTSDFPITLASVEASDTYEGNLGDRREIIWTLTFQANVSYYGISSAVNVIKKVDVGIYANSTMSTMVDPDVRYHVEVNPLTASATDNYTFLEGWS